MYFHCLSGFELTFYSGVFGTCIGAINWFGADAKSLIGLSGIFVGLGEVLGWYFSSQFSFTLSKWAL